MKRGGLEVDLRPWDAAQVQDLLNASNDVQALEALLSLPLDPCSAKEGQAAVHVAAEAGGAVDFKLF